MWIALLGTSTDRQTRLFMGWFGPKGVATMTFSLLVLDQHIASGQRIFDLTALVVFCSIVAPRPHRHARGELDRPPRRADENLGVQRGLFLRRWERPRGARAALLAEHEPQLLRRRELRLGGTEGGAGLGEVQGAEQIALEEAILAGDLAGGSLALLPRH